MANEEDPIDGLTLILRGGLIGNFEFNTTNLIGKGKFGEIYRGKCHGLVK